MQYRAEVIEGNVTKVTPAYGVMGDGVMERDGKLILRIQAESLAEARALAQFEVYSLKKKGML